MRKTKNAFVKTFFTFLARRFHCRVVRSFDGRPSAQLALTYRRRCGNTSRETARCCPGPRRSSDTTTGTRIDCPSCRDRPRRPRCPKGPNNNRESSSQVGKSLRLIDNTVIRSKHSLNEGRKTRPNGINFVQGVHVCTAVQRVIQCCFCALCLAFPPLTAGSELFRLSLAFVARLLRVQRRKRGRLLFDFPEKKELACFLIHKTCVLYCLTDSRPKISALT